MKRRSFIKPLFAGVKAVVIPVCRQPRPEPNRSPVQVVNAWSEADWAQAGWDKLLTEEHIIDSDPNDPENWAFIQDPGEIYASEELSQKFQDRLNQFSNTCMNKIRMAKAKYPGL